MGLKASPGTHVLLAQAMLRFHPLVGGSQCPLRRHSNRCGELLLPSHTNRHSRTYKSHLGGSKSARLLQPCSGRRCWVACCAKVGVMLLLPVVGVAEMEVAVRSLPWRAVGAVTWWTTRTLPPARCAAPHRRQRAVWQRSCAPPRAVSRHAPCFGPSFFVVRAPRRRAVMRGVWWLRLCATPAWDWRCTRPRSLGGVPAGYRRPRRHHTLLQLARTSHSPPNAVHW